MMSWNEKSRRSHTKVFTPIFGPIYGPNEEDMIDELDTFLRTMADGVLTLSLIYAEMSSYYERPDYTFLKIAGRPYLLTADGGDELTALEEKVVDVPEIYAITRYAKWVDKIWARGPLDVDERFKKTLLKTLIRYYRDASYYDDVEEEEEKWSLIPSPASISPSIFSSSSSCARVATSACFSER